MHVKMFSAVDEGNTLMVTKACFLKTVMTVAFLNSYHCGLTVERLFKMCFSTLMDGCKRTSIAEQTKKDYVFLAAKADGDCSSKVVLVTMVQQNIGGDSTGPNFKE